MANTADVKKVAGMLKKGMTAREIKKELDLGAELDPVIWEAEVINTPSLKFKATAAKVVAARDKEGLRWERIALRTDLSIGEVKKLYEQGGGNVSASWTGRGRPPANGASKPAKKAESKGKASKGGQSAKKGGVKRARTRAERQAKAANPS